MSPQGRLIVAAAALASSIALGQSPIDPVWVAQGRVPTGEYGHAMAGVGDLDGDGFPDLAIAEPYFNTGAATQYGIVDLFRGSPSGPGGLPDVWVQEWVNFGNLGTSVSGGGDVQGDAFDELLAGSSISRVAAYYGSPAGVHAEPDWTAYPPSATGDTVVASAGDVDGDGYDDVVVGARNFSNGQTGEGRIYLYRGSPAGLSELPSQILESDRANAGFGGALSGAGDLTGDGHADVLVGAAGEDKAFLYSGSTTGLEPVPVWEVSDAQPGTGFGASIALLGDFDGDGQADTAVAAPHWSDGQ